MAGAMVRAGLVWRIELKYAKIHPLSISPYAVYDAGQFRYNSEMLKFTGEDMHTVSSAGLVMKPLLHKT